MKFWRSTCLEFRRNSAETTDSIRRRSSGDFERAAISVGYESIGISSNTKSHSDQQHEKKGRIEKTMQKQS